MRRFARFGAATLCLAAASFGCKKPVTAPKFDPEANSGPDGKRAGAVAIDVNKQYTDNVDFDKMDRTDWKSVELKGRPGPLEVVLHWDTAPADLSLDIMDGIGVLVASSPATTGEPTRTLTVPIQELGTYFIRIQAPKAGAASDYTIEAKWSAEAPPPPPPAPVVEEPVKEKKEPRVKKEPKAPRPPKVAAGSPENALQGRVVQSHPEGGNVVLYLDKGAAAGVKEGQNGWILDGPSGFNILGTLKITKVVDDSRSIGVTGTKIGRNNRIAINTGK